LTGSTRCRLQLEPFRGVRYDPGRYRRLPQVTAPPYDVIGRDDAVALEHADPHNIVRAILPREDDRHPDRYAAAAALWRTWLDDGTLTVDDTPSLYVYEQVGTPGIAGVIGAVRLHGPGCGAACTVVLPHEDVMPGPVTDRLDLLSSTQANLEPILSRTRATAAPPPWSPPSCSAGPWSRRTPPGTSIGCGRWTTHGTRRW
jgi:uncharacterized protein (DUF1015 family)